MDKEKLITVAIGLTVGIVIAGLYFAAVKFLPNFHFNPPKIAFNSSSVPKEEPKSTPETKTVTKNLTVDLPADESTTKDNPLTVSGKTLPGAKVTVFANADEKIASADAQGNFSASIKLEEGENVISVTSLANMVKPETVARSVILEATQ